MKKTERDQVDRDNAAIVLWLKASIIILKTVLILLLMYWSISLFAYSWRNPELTQMQIFKNSWEAMKWEK